MGQVTWKYAIFCLKLFDRALVIEVGIIKRVKDHPPALKSMKSHFVHQITHFSRKSKIVGKKQVMHKMYKRQTTCDYSINI